MLGPTRRLQTPPGCRGEGIGLALLAAALTFNAIVLAPEIRIGRLPPNDATFHLAAAERLEESFARGEPFLDPWVSEWSLGYPLWRSYQPLPHLAAAAVLRMTEPLVSHSAAFAALQYLLLVLVPASCYLGARLLGLPAAAAGLSALLIAAPSAAGELAPYGLGWAATTWRGAGLYTQLFAFHLLVPALGALARALDSGRRLVATAVLVALTALSHIVFGYVVLGSAIVFAAVGPPGERARRVVRLVTILGLAGLLVAWFVVPLFLGRHEITHSRWEGQFKFNSFGAVRILGDLAAGRLLDSGRSPFLTALVGVGALAAIVSVRETVPRRLLALAVVWLVLFFGRTTWGYLLYLAAVPGDLHVHRLQAAFELSVVLLAGWGIERTVRAAAGAGRWLALAAAAAVVAVIVPIGRERAAFVALERVWGDASLAAHADERADLEATFADVRAILAERPGRVAAGLAASWGGQFMVGSLPVFSFLTREHFDEVTFMYHSLSRTSDVMVLRDEGNPAHDRMMGIRVIVAPSSMTMPAHLRLRATHGQFAVYEDSPEGYFGLVDVGAVYTGSLATFYEASATWLAGALPWRGVVLALGDDVPGVRRVARWEPFPAAPPRALRPRGTIVSETKVGETYRARVALQRDCYALVKMTWHPDLVATVDGSAVPLLRVTPGFGAVALGAGEHEVVVSYRPGPLKPLLLLLGAGLVSGIALALRRPAAVAVEDRLTTRVAAAGRLATPRVQTALLLAALALLALRPLFRGRLVDADEAAAEPLRLTEMVRAFEANQVPPAWAPDLGSGHGQPLFEFVPPLFHTAAAGLRVLGLGIADSLQLPLAGLFLVGAAALYVVARRFTAPRPALLACAAWLFSPYVQRTLYARADFVDAAALATAPVVLLGVVRALDRPSPARAIAAATGIALALLTHDATAMPLLAALGVLIAARAWPRDVAAAVAGGAALLGGLGLGAFFWLPEVWERAYVHADRLADAARAAGLASPLRVVSDLGPVHVAAALAGLALSLARGKGPARAERLAFAVAVAAGAWLATTWAEPAWSHVAAIAALRLPSRALGVPALLLPLLAIPAFERLGPRLSLATGALLVLLHLPNALPRGFLVFDDEFYAPDLIAKNELSTAAADPWEPRWVAERPPYGEARPAADGTTVRTLTRGAARQEFVVQATEQGQVALPLFYFPGWRVRVDGAPTDVRPAPGSGTIALRVPAGTHVVVAELEPTPIRRLAVVLSAATAVLLGLAGAALHLPARGRTRLVTRPSPP